MHIWDYNSLLPQMCDVELFSSFMNNAVAHCSKIQFVVHLIKFFKMQIVISILALKFKSFQFDLSTQFFADNQLLKKNQNNSNLVTSLITFFVKMCPSTTLGPMCKLYTNASKYA